MPDIGLSQAANREMFSSCPPRLSTTVPVRPVVVRRPSESIYFSLSLPSSTRCALSPRRLTRLGESRIVFRARPYRYPPRSYLVVPFLQGAKLYYKHQVYGTRPNPKRGKNAVVRVQDLESGEQFRLNTEHAVLNVPTEVSRYMCSWFCDGRVVNH